MERFTSREILQLERNGLRVKADLDPALVALEEANIIRKVEEPPRPKGGAPRRLYVVNPAIRGAK